VLEQYSCVLMQVSAVFDFESHSKKHQHRFMYPCVARYSSSVG
jgi:hypothetical protein